MCAHVAALVAAAHGVRAGATRQFKQAVDHLAAVDSLAAAYARLDFGRYWAEAAQRQRAQPLLAAAARFFENIGNKRKAGRIRGMVPPKKKKPRAPRAKK
jgi:hypothetical protein